MQSMIMLGLVLITRAVFGVRLEAAAGRH